jgi:hypothetical protein
MSAGRDFELLASSSKRSGDDMKAAVALFNLGVTLDNSRQYAKAIEVCMAAVCASGTPWVLMCERCDQ